jgi:S1-C subfamily serine protease
MSFREEEPPLSLTVPLAESWRGRLQRLGSRLRSAVPFAAGVLAALLALLLYNLLFPAPAPLTARDLSDTIAQTLASATAPPALSASVYQAVAPSLVLIQAQPAGTTDPKDKSLGSGVIINTDGAILTSLHVVEGADDIQLMFADGTQANARIIAAQPENDIAVLSASRLPAVLVPATLGNPNALRIGDEAFALGNPFGLYGSLSAGVVSGLNRSFQPPNRPQRLHGLIQIDAAVNPGNSGGPLVNRAGQVVGIIVGIINPTEQDVFIGIGLAVPINVAAEAAGLPSH